MKTSKSYDFWGPGHFLILCLVLSTVQLSSAAFFKFNKIHITSASWKPTQTISNMRSDMQCAARCFNSYDCTAYCYDETLQQCQLGRKGPVVRVSVSTDNIRCFALPGNYKLLTTTGLTSANAESAGSEIINLESSAQVTCPAVPDFPKAAAGSSGALIQNKIPLFCSGFPNQTSCYFLKNNTWVPTGSLKQGRYYAGLLPNSPYQDPTHQAIIIGGYNAATMEVFNGSIWSIIGPSLPDKIGESCILYRDPTTIYFIGGTLANSRQYFKDTYFLDVQQQKWLPGPKITVGRVAAGCGRIRTNQNSDKQSIIIAGGYNGAVLDSVEILDDDSNNWRGGPKLPGPAAAPSTFEDPRGGVVVVGGHDGSSNSATVYRLRHVGLNAQWETLVQKAQLVLRSSAALAIPDEIVTC